MLELLPTSGSFLHLKLVREAREELSFTDKETQKLQFTTSESTNTIKWVGNLEREFTFGPVITEMVVKALLALDKKEALEDRHFGVYQKFIPSQD